MMRILMDTNALYVAAGMTDLAFSPKVMRLLGSPDTDRILSTVSIMEVAIKYRKGSTTLTSELMDKAIVDLQLTVIPFTQHHALPLFTLPPHHSDPWDRMLIATALTEDITIVSPDKEFKAYKGLRVIW